MQGRCKVLVYARQQAKLVYVNAWDHLITLARILGADGAMPLFSQASVSRVIAEAAVRFAWLMDPDVNSAQRLVRGAAALQYSAGERSKGVRAVPAKLIDPREYQQMLDSSSQEQDAIRELIDGAGMTLKKKGGAKVELQSADVEAPLRINVSEYMAAWLPDSPSWYNIGSSVTHSIYWGLRAVNHSKASEPLALTPSVREVGAAAWAALCASALILDRSGRMNGHDPTPHVRPTYDRRAEVDALLRRAATSIWAHVAADPPRDKSPAG
jgi:hypothetical protein